MKKLCIWQHLMRERMVVLALSECLE